MSRSRARLTLDLVRIDHRRSTSSIVRGGFRLRPLCARAVGCGENAAKIVGRWPTPRRASVIESSQRIRRRCNAADRMSWSAAGTLAPLGTKHPADVDRAAWERRVFECFEPHPSVPETEAPVVTFGAFDPYFAD